MANEPVFNTTSSQSGYSSSSSFRRIEDWERLTRLEFIVEEVIRDNGRRDERIDAIIQACEKVSDTQGKVIGHIRMVKNLLLGVLAGMSIAYFGLENVLSAIVSMAGLAG